MTFPFDHVIITFPDASAAQWAASDDDGPLQRLRTEYKVMFTATFDPIAGLGSGGGTLAALRHATSDQVVLLIHAGGASSRCPTQMVLGKAWTTLPSTNGHDTPIHVWLRTVALFFGSETRLPPGTVVIVASDTLLRLPSAEEYRVDWGNVLVNSVVGVTVPAPLRTAQNHGVYQLVEPDSDGEGPRESSRSAVQLRRCVKVWQKPSIEILKNAIVTGESKSAWIDTGVTIVGPCAAQALRSLTDMFVVAQNRIPTGEIPSLDLYTHVLQALRLECDQTRDDYIEAHPSLRLPMAEAVWTALSPVNLHVLAAPYGSFLHLGTTAELSEFLLQGAARPNVDTKSDREQLCRLLGQHYGLSSRHRSFTRLPDYLDPAQTVLSHSLVTQSPDDGQRTVSHVGPGSILEYCQLQDVQVLSIGRDCLVSDLRDSSRVIQIPDSMIVQQVPLRNNGGYVFLTLGKLDDVKGCTDLFNRPLGELITTVAIWNDGEEQNVWNAHVHPVCTAGQSFSHFFRWLCNPHDERSWVCWKNAHKMSLAEIRQHGDASALFRHRRFLSEESIPASRSQHISRIQQILLDRRNDPIDLWYEIEVYQKGQSPVNFQVIPAFDVFNALDDVILSAHDQRKLDVCARALTVIGTLLDSLPDLSEESSRAACQSVCDSILVASRHLESNATFKIIISDLSAARNRHLSSRGVPPVLRDTYEDVRRCVTSWCVYNNRAIHIGGMSSPPGRPVIDKWVMARAPARIDFAGGWTDTPPVCFEYGSTVVGAAVTIDGKVPICCRCRIRSTGKGMLLRTVQRSVHDGSILSSNDVEPRSLKEVADFVDPTSDCALLKCAIKCLGFGCADSNGDDPSFQELINRFCATEGDCRLEVVATSLLPQGSGMGTSSIMAGCVLAAVGQCLGRCFLPKTGANDLSLNILFQAILELEQRLTTGGGFQDQVNGVVGGIKRARSRPQTYPLSLVVDRLPCCAAFAENLNDRLVLVYTGKTRLARNILIRVLRRWALRSPEIINTVRDLVDTANHCADSICNEDLDALGLCISQYWQQKRAMAGSESGVLPIDVQMALESPQVMDIARGAALCGAGGGGFLYLLLKDGVLRSHARHTLEQFGFEWHECSLTLDGLRVLNLPNNFNAIEFDATWLTTNP